MEVWKYGSMEVSKYGSMEVWKYRSIEVWKYRSMEVSKYRSIEVWKCGVGNAGPHTIHHTQVYNHVTMLSYKHLYVVMSYLFGSYALYISPTLYLIKTT